ncbi:MAG: HesA/MoeB/ThiF family protein [Phycisphaerae bacterium]
MKQSNEGIFQRYARQIIVPQVGLAGQEKLLKSKVVIVGCGGLGCTIGQILARTGVGELFLCDSDKVELDNLHRQILYDEKDLGKAKAVLSAEKLLQINSQVKCHALPIRIDEKNVVDLINQSDLIVDATDNLASRYMLNTAATQIGRDWIYGGCVGTEGTVMLVRNRTGACLECLFGPYDAAEQNPPGKFPILPTTPVVVGAIEAHEVIRYLLTNDEDKPSGSKVISIDLWQSRVRSSNSLAKNPGCDRCGKK